MQLNQINTKKPSIPNRSEFPDENIQPQQDDPQFDSVNSPFQNQPTGSLFSLHARGVFWRVRDLLHRPRRSFLKLWREIRDIGLSYLSFLLLTNWTTGLALLVTILAYLYYRLTDDDNTVVVSIEWTTVGFVVVLPLLMWVWMVYIKRDKALVLLGQIRADVIYIYAMCGEQSMNSPGRGQQDEESVRIRLALVQVLDSLEQFLTHGQQHARSFYAQHVFRATVDKQVMISSKELLEGMKKVRSDIRSLLAVVRSCREGNRESVLSSVLKILQNIEELQVIKEYRSPMVLRAYLNFFVSIFIPLFMAPYWAQLGNDGSFGIYPVFAALFINTCLQIVLNYAIQLEDPFYGPVDAVSCLEQIDWMKWSIDDFGRQDMNVVVADQFSQSHVENYLQQQVVQPPPQPPTPHIEITPEI